MAPTSPSPDLVGASDPSVALPGVKTTTRVTFQEAARQAVLARIAGKRPVKAYLNLEHVTGSGLHGTYQVFIDVPHIGAAPAEQPPLLAGIMSTFGVRKASLKDGPHGGSGITTVLEITPLIAQLHHERAWDGHHLDVTLVPEVPPGRTEVMPPSDLKIGRVSVYYG
jgi:tyrosinase